MTHSPEPWEPWDYGDFDCLIRYGLASGGFREQADAERAAACVNFCRQFPTEWLATHQLVYIDSQTNIPTCQPKTLANIPGFSGLVACTLIPVAKNQP
jgi:hypothetical protein